MAVFLLRERASNPLRQGYEPREMPNLPPAHLQYQAICIFASKYCAKCYVQGIIVVSSMNIKKLSQEAKTDIAKAKDEQELEVIRVKYLGRNGSLTEILRSLKSVPIAKRKVVGTEANSIRRELEEKIEQQKKAFTPLKSKKTFSDFDTTKPGHKIHRGHQHPLSLIDEEVRNIFKAMNFSIVDGPEIETAKYNFDALNIPASHPARDMWDTLWIKDSGKLMRTHTSPMQIRYMESHNPPFQIIVPGRVFRYEATDSSHEINFYQLEGLMVGKDITLANFKFIVERFLKSLFGDSVEFRFRPSYFPFVEPGLEVDMKFTGGKWLEIMGAGMVHRNVFDAVKYNPNTVQGFAFGVGLDRLAMIKYNIPDIRLLYSGDVRLTRQF